METEVKSLKTKRTKLQNEIKEIRNTINTLKTERDLKNKTIDDNLKHIKQLETELENLKKTEDDQLNAANGIIVSEHAIIRYFERVLGFDIEKIKREMVPEKIKDQIKLMKSGLFPVGELYKLRVRQRTIVTLLTED